MTECLQEQQTSPHMSASQMAKYITVTAPSTEQETEPLLQRAGLICSLFPGFHNPRALRNVDGRRHVPMLLAFSHPISSET